MNSINQLNDVPATNGDQQNQYVSLWDISLFPQVVCVPHTDAEIAACYERYQRSDVPRLHYRGVSDAENVFQQSFVDALKKLSIDDPKFEPYLRIKEKDYKAAAYRDEVACCPLSDDVDNYTWVEPAQLAHLEMVESRELLHRAMAHLSPEDQLMLRLLFWEEQSCEKIGEQFGMPAGTVKSRTHRARAALRVLLEEAGLTR